MDTSMSLFKIQLGDMYVQLFSTDVNILDRRPFCFQILC